LLVGIADTLDFIDTDAEYSVKYRYTAVAFSTDPHANAESAPSLPVEYTAIDKFPPSTPSNVTALASGNSIEVSWERSPEADTRGYYVYRSVDSGAFARLNDLQTLPAFSDKDVQPGKKYRYEVSAIDVRDNESRPSNPVEASL
jgi:fibronectin type 3 domain-containing protein